jgi:hypothetical protein
MIRWGRDMTRQERTLGVVSGIIALVGGSYGILMLVWSWTH